MADKISPETRATLRHSQLQEGLRYRILQTQTVSGAQTYSELCLAANNEEKPAEEREISLGSSNSDAQRTIQETVNTIC